MGRRSAEPNGAERDAYFSASPRGRISNTSEEGAVRGAPRGGVDVCDTHRDSGAIFVIRPAGLIPCRHRPDPTPSPHILARMTKLQRAVLGQLKQAIDDARSAGVMVEYPRGAFVDGEWISWPFDALNTTGQAGAPSEPVCK